MCNQNIDLTTVIYVAKGFMSNVDLFDKANRCYCQGGELELLTEVGRLAQYTDKTYEDLALHYDGVFAYDIAEPLGEWMVEWLVQHEDLPSPDLVVIKATELLKRHESDEESDD